MLIRRGWNSVVFVLDLLTQGTLGGRWQVYLAEALA